MCLQLFYLDPDYPLIFKVEHPQRGTKNNSKNTQLFKTELYWII